MSYHQQQQDKGTMFKVTDFLFGVHDIKQLENLDIRTDVPTTEMYELLHYYQILEELGSDVAGNIKNNLEALNVSIKRKGREEGVQVLEQKAIPKTEMMYRSAEQGVSSESES